jgi:hypothetical protein
MDPEARPKIQLMGNSLTSISSIATFPPSPIAQRSRSAYVGAVSGHKPNDTQVDPLGLASPPEEVVERPLSPPGSVPSPKARFAHLHASAPARPRLPRPASYTSTRIPSPLNPASQHLKPTPQSPSHPADGSVPNPKPNRLFTSLLNCPSLQPASTESILPKDQQPLERRPLRLRNGQKGSAPRKISPSGLNAHLRPDVPAPLSIIETEDLSPPEEGESGGPSTCKAPNSFSTFVASMESLR